MAASAGAQAPIWVPLLVGVIGLAGVLATQIVASVRARSERRSADQREDLRWSRAQEERRDAAAREDRYRSHDDRTHAYANLVLEVTRWRDRLGRAGSQRAANDHVADTKISLPVIESQRAAEEAEATVALLAPDTVRAACEAAGLSLLKATIVLMDDTAPAEALDAYTDAVKEPAERMIELMRADLEASVEPHPTPPRQ
jgi:hypothetical protein